jgi:Dockerin type I domain
VNGATVTPGSGGTASVSGAPVASGHQITVNLTNVSSAQTLMVNLIGVTAGGSSDNVSFPVSILVGDTNQDHFTDAIDVSQTKSQSGNAVTYSNFREDVNVDGFIDSVDAALVKSKSGTSLP